MGIDKNAVCRYDFFFFPLHSVAVSPVQAREQTRYISFFALSMSLDVWLDVNYMAWIQFSSHFYFRIAHIKANKSIKL